MPITPNEISELRKEASIKKLVEIIDKGLTDHPDDTPFVFTFKKGTSPVVISSIHDIYQKAGWNAVLQNSTDENNKALLTLSIKYLLEPDNDIRKEVSKLSKDKQRDLVIAAALETDLTREALVQAMLEPIENYVSGLNIARKVLSTYFYDVNNYSNNFDDNKYKLVHLQSTFSNKVVDGKYYDAIDKIQIEIQNTIIKEETLELFRLLNANLKQENIIHTYPETLQRAIRDSIANIFDAGMPACKILLNHHMFQHLLHIDQKSINRATNRDYLMANLSGNFDDSVDIHEVDSNVLSKNQIFITGPGQFIGKIFVPVENCVKKIHFKNNTITVDVDYQSYMEVIDKDMISAVHVRF